MPTRVRRSRMNSAPEFSSHHHETYVTYQRSLHRVYSAVGAQVVLPPHISNKDSTHRHQYSGQARQIKAIIDTIPAESLRFVSLTFHGQVIQKAPRAFNMLVFTLSGICCACNLVMKAQLYRKKFFTTYTEKNFGQILNIVQRLKFCQSLVINFQDSYFSEELAHLLEQSIKGLPAKIVTIRNLSYRMDSKDCSHYFASLRNGQQRTVTYVWQNIFDQTRGHIHDNSLILSSDSD